MSAAPRKSPVTAKQRAADKANLVKARAAQRRSGALHHHTAKQQAASRQNLVKARVAQKARRAGKKPVSSKSAQLALDLAKPVLADPGWPGIHSLPACAAVAVAASLESWGGRPGEPELLALHEMTAGMPLGGVLEAVASAGLGGWRLALFEAADPDLYLDGLLYGIRLSPGYHAVLGCPGGMRSWGMVLPLRGTPEEAWMLEWEGPGNGR